MPVAPTGAPAWARSATADIYGGHADKRDFQGQGPVNPKTDVSAAQFARLCADLAAVSRVAPFCRITLTCEDTPAAAPTVNSVQQMDAVSTSGYVGSSPPSGLPTCTRLGDGSVQIVFASTPADEFSVSEALVIRHVQASVIGASAYASVQVTVVNDTTIQLTAVNSSSAAIQDAQISVEVG